MISKANAYHFICSKTKETNLRIHTKTRNITDLISCKVPQKQQQIFDEAVQAFEDKCQSLSHFCCDCCKMTGITLRPSYKSKLVCSTCQASHANKEDMIKDLPIWYDKNGKVQFNLPTQLQRLREGEKLLIQQVAVYVPLLHLKDGQIGSRGHVCSFVQDISKICTVLPRLPDNVQFVKVVKKYLQEGGQIASKMFVIRKKVVLDALKWLKEYNVEYANIQIQESNLDWIENNVAQELPATLIQMDDEAATNNSPASVDMGPCETQTLSGLQKDSDDACKIESVLGVLPSIAPHLPKEKDEHVISTINADLDHHNKKNHTTIEFPYVSVNPINEYDDSSLFTRAFPWLFPGGVGDFGQFRDKKLNVGDWTRRMLYYQDGRFAKDRIWCFFALDFATRKRNQTSGGFFVDGFFKEGPKTLEELQTEIAGGNTQWLERLCYYSQRVAGSSGYWRAKRAEVYTWINHHIEAGHGPPTFFITLSCAEYMWPDIRQLITDRFIVAGMDTSALDKSFVQIVNDYTLVVQEYFQERVKIWLSTIGAAIYHIKHYWLRYEFAPSRGQIHAHILAIHENPLIMEPYYKYSQNREKQEEFLHQWMTEELGITARFPKTTSNFNSQSKSHPSKSFYKDISNKKDEDFVVCLEKLQYHKCSAFCMRKRRIL